MQRAWEELPGGDRNRLERISADQWEVCGRALGTYTDDLLRSAGLGSLSQVEIARANAALALWVPELRVVLINESHPAFDGLDGPTLNYDLSRVAWHEWGHALSRLPEGTTMADVRRLDQELLASEDPEAPGLKTHEAKGETPPEKK